MRLRVALCLGLMLEQPALADTAAEQAAQAAGDLQAAVTAMEEAEGARDSVAALTPRAEIEGEMGDSSVGMQARLMSKALRKLTSTISKTGCCCIFINQLREKIGVMFGNPETTTGGNALKFYASIRLDILRIQLLGCSRVFTRSAVGSFLRSSACDHRDGDL